MLAGKIIAITGSSGFVGSSLAKKFRAEKAEVIELDVKKGIDITEWRQIETIDKMDVVIHLAARTSIPDSFQRPREFIHINVNGTLNMLELCRKYNARMIFASSSFVYGRPRYLPINEIHPCIGDNPYAVSKIIGEELCHGYYKSFGVKVAIARPFNIYGPGQTADSLISGIVSQVRTGKIVLKDPLPKRDFVYIQDVIDAYAKMCEYATTDFEVFNIGSGKSYSVQEIVDTVCDISGIPAEIEFTHERRQNEIPEMRSEIAKANEVLNWHPRFDLNNGIRKIFGFTEHEKTD